MDKINLSKSFTSSKIGVIALTAPISGPKNTVELHVLWGLERQKHISLLLKRETAVILLSLLSWAVSGFPQTTMIFWSPN